MLTLGCRTSGSEPTPAVLTRTNIVRNLLFLSLIAAVSGACSFPLAAQYSSLSNAKGDSLFSGEFMKEYTAASRLAGQTRVAGKA